MFRKLLSWFAPTSAAKFWVAGILGAAEFARVRWGYDLGLDEETTTAVVHGVIALSVWIVPNRPRLPRVPTGLW